MKHQYLPLKSFAACVALLAGVSPAAAEDSLGKLAWLSGCWSAEGAEPGSGEQWMPIAGASMLGMGRTVRQGKTSAHEFMRIAPGSDGKLVFFAQPSGKPPASFPVQSLSASEVVFENPEHDFPQRVIYRFQPPASLHASIEGTRGGSLKRIEFPMVKVSCDLQFAGPTQ